MGTARRVDERAAELLEDAIGERGRSGAASGERQDEQRLRIVVRELVIHPPAVAAVGFVLRELRRDRADRAAAEQEAGNRREKQEAMTGYRHPCSRSWRQPPRPGLPSTGA